MPKTPNKDTPKSVFGWYRDSSFFTIDSTILLVIVLSGILFAYSAEEQVSANDRATCKSFISRASAQGAFNLNPQKYRALDHNHNGLVCEDTSY